jgi:biopolymer transport protein ExbD
MLFRRRKKGDGSEGDAVWEMPTSMIDVVFLLLIFFMCASKFRTLEKRLDALMPREGPGPGPVSHTEEIPIRVGTHSSSARLPRFQLYRWVTHDPNELAAHLRRFPRPVNYRVVIDGESNCPFQHIMSAMDACARADMNKVSFRPPLTTNG